MIPTCSRIAAPSCLLLALLPLWPGPVAAAPVDVGLSPASATVAIRAYGMGLLPLDGTFDRFDGQLRYNEQGRVRDCRVDLNVDVASLTVSGAAIRDTILGPDFLDARRYPRLRFAGACSGDEITGQLTMHGVTHPFALSLAHTATGLVAQGRLRRAAWDMTAQPWVGGSTVRITVDVRLPSGSVH